MADQVRINKNIVSWGSIKVKCAGETFHGFDMLAYGDRRTRTKHYGMGRHHAPRARTSGKYEVDVVKLRGPKGTVQALRQKLADAGDGTSYGNTPCQVIAEFVEADDTPMLVEIEDCVICSDTSSHEENTDPLKDEIELDAMMIRRNGLTLFDSSEGSPA